MRKMTQDEVLRATFKYQDALTAYAYGLLQDWQLAQDVVQESYIVLLKKWKEYDPDQNIYSWVRQIIRYEALNVLRSRKREQYVEDEELLSLVDEQFESHLDEKAALKMKKERTAFQECMSRLGKESLGLLLGFYRDRKSCEKLSALYKKSVNAIRLTLSRMRKKLHDCIMDRLTGMEN